MRLLLVEGVSDQRFFQHICRSLDLHASVRVAPPREVQGGHNSKEGVFKHLPLLLKQFEDGSLERLAVIVDADDPRSNGLGYQRTLERVMDIVTPAGFMLPKRPPPQQRGILFTHTDGFADLGLWIMPNNRHDGCLEDFVQACVIPAEQPLFTRAQAVVAALPSPRRFSETKLAKAEMATWLSWQADPGRGPHYAMQAGLLSVDAEPFIGLAGWLRHIYR